jgi:uncharacterized protein (DUF1330 family)
MSSALTLVVLLWVRPGHEEDFERFETAAADIMGRHGGRIERRLPLEPGDDPERPNEVHIVTFPDPAAFERYRADPELARLQELRERAIRRTTVWANR